MVVYLLDDGWLAKKIFSDNPKVGFLAVANKFSAAAEQGSVLAPAKTLVDMQRIVLNNQVNAALCGFFMLVAVVMLVSAVLNIRAALASRQPTTHESDAEWRGGAAHHA